jgi:hypothetical protein
MQARACYARASTIPGASTFEAVRAIPAASRNGRRCSFCEHVAFVGLVHKLRSRRRMTAPLVNPPRRRKGSVGPQTY